MTDRPDRPMSSDEMLDEARSGLQHREPTPPEPDRRPSEAVPVERSRPSEPTSAPRAGKRPSPPPERTRPSMDPQAQRRAVLLVAIALSLVIAGFVAAIVFARAGI